MMAPGDRMRARHGDTEPRGTEQHYRTLRFSAYTPCNGVKRVIREHDPSYAQFCQPPNSVPRRHRPPDREGLTQYGTSNALLYPWAKSSTAMTPMVFCASLPP